VVSEVINAVFVLFLLAGLPALSVWTARSEDLAALPRKSIYFSAALSQWLLAIVTFIIALTTAGGLAGFQTVQRAVFVTWTALVLLIALGGIRLVLLLEERGWWPEESKWIYALIPRTKSEKLWALALLAPTAGFCEEFVYRGYLLAQLSRYLHSITWAWIISSLAFGMAHTYQKPSGVARATLLGALLAWPVVRLGSIYPAIVAHFLIDAVALAWLGPWSLKREGKQRTGLI
jgi:membrane protease YdiL (CAAX protease family)